MSTGRDSVRRENDYRFATSDRVVEARSAFSISDVIERLRVDMQNASSRDYFALARELYALLTEEGRHDEALRLAEEVIAQDPDDVLFAIWRATLCQECLGDLQKASESIDVALARALRTREWLRYALGVKARVLLALGRGEDIAPVLEQIMSLKLDRDIADISRERDFVDAAPPRRISADVVACYDRFCPKPADGSPLELLEFEPPKFDADGEEIPFARDGHGAIIVSTDGATSWTT